MFIEEKYPEPGWKIKVAYWELFDGPICLYIKSDYFIVTDDEGNEITECDTMKESFNTIPTPRPQKG